jgi:uncharacterized phage infection (PIP) family protein YhgE
MIRQLKMALYLSIALAVLTAGALGYYYFEASGTIKERNTTITTLQSQIDSQKTQIDTLGSQLSTAQESVTSANTQISSLNSQLSSLNNQVSSAQGILTAANTQIATLQSQLTAANNQITDLTTQNASLQSIGTLSRTTTVTSAATLSQSPTQETSIAYFTASYAGYILVTGYSSSTTGYIRVTDSFTGYPYSSTQLSFGTGNSLYIPLLPGTVIVYFGNTETTSAVTANLNVTYYY